MCIVVWIESLQGFIKNQIIGRRRPRGLCKIETCCTDCIIRIHPHNITIRRHRRTSSQIMIIQLKYECLCQSILSNPATHFFFNKSIIKSIFSSDYVSKSNHTKLAPFFRLSLSNCHSRGFCFWYNLEYCFRGLWFLWNCTSLFAIPQEVLYAKGIIFDETLSSLVLFSMFLSFFFHFLNYFFFSWGEGGVRTDLIFNSFLQEIFFLKEQTKKLEIFYLNLDNLQLKFDLYNTLSLITKHIFIYISISISLPFSFLKIIIYAIIIFFY